MIDRVKITFPKEHFTGNFENCSKQRSGKYYKKYILQNAKNDHYLVILVNIKTGNISVEGSLRKWMFGESSLLDLDKKTFRRCFSKVAAALNMSLSDFGQGKITQCEIGLNIRVRESCNSIVPSFIEYGRMRKAMNWGHKNETLYFNGNDKKFVAYDKAEEIVAKTKGRKCIARKRHIFGVLANHGYHFLRMEFKLFDRRSFRLHNLGHIENVADINTNWENLYEFWTCEVSKLLLFTHIDYCKTKDEKEYLLARFINSIQDIESYGDKLKELLGHCNRKNRQATNAARHKLHKKIISLFDKCRIGGEYNKYKLRTDIALNLMRIQKKGENLDLPFLIRNLWGVSNRCT